ncbi:hypothetical protein AVDCRST_MAG84-2168, partial [uncultured Microcoleus sp.]
ANRDSPLAEASFRVAAAKSRNCQALFAASDSRREATINKL